MSVTVKMIIIMGVTQPNDFLKANAEVLLSGQSNPQVLCLADGEGTK